MTSYFIIPCVGSPGCWGLMVTKNHLSILECSFPCNFFGQFLPIFHVWAWKSLSWSRLLQPPHAPLKSVSSNVHTLLTPVLLWIGASLLCLHVCLLHGCIPASHTGDLHKCLWTEWQHSVDPPGKERVLWVWTGCRVMLPEMAREENGEGQEVAGLDCSFFKVKKQQGHVSSRKQRIQLILKPPSFL